MAVVDRVVPWRPKCSNWRGDDQTITACAIGLCTGELWGGGNAKRIIHNMQVLTFGRCLGATRREPQKARRVLRIPRYSLSPNYMPWFVQLASVRADTSHTHVAISIRTSPRNSNQTRKDASLLVHFLGG